MKNKISITILTKNSEKYMRECLTPLADFDEVVLLDNGSVDDTMKIASEFSNVRIFKHDFIGFGPMKQLAVSYTKNEWILSVDSDEILSKQLVDEILTLDLNKQYIYSILRDNYYKKKLVKACGWDNDYQLRLFNKISTNFNAKQVHEGLIIKENMKVKKLQYSFKHYTFESISELLQKMDNYSNLYAQEHVKKKKTTPLQAIAKAFFAFIKNYFLQKGFLYGYEGLLISISNANGVFYKYMKLYEENKK